MVCPGRQLGHQSHPRPLKPERRHGSLARFVASVCLEATSGLARVRTPKENGASDAREKSPNNPYFSNL